MKKEDCKVGTLVRARNGSSVGKIVEVNDETSTLSVAVVPLDRYDSAIWWEPGQLTRLGDLPTRTFCVGDKVRYVPRGLRDDFELYYAIGDVRRKRAECKRWNPPGGKACENCKHTGTVVGDPCFSCCFPYQGEPNYWEPR